MDLINVSVVLYCIVCELTEVCSECCDSCLAIKSGESHDCLVHERGNNLGLTVDENLIILAIGKQCRFGLLGEAVVETAPHLFIVLCCSLVCIDACGENKGLASCLECFGIDLAVFGNEADLSAVLVCEL